MPTSKAIYLHYSPASLPEYFNRAETQEKNLKTKYVMMIDAPKQETSKYLTESRKIKFEGNVKNLLKKSKKTMVKVNKIVYFKDLNWR